VVRKEAVLTLEWFRALLLQPLNQYDRLKMKMLLWNKTVFLEPFQERKTSAVL